MTKEEAESHLKEVIQPDGGLFSLGWYLAWPSAGGKEAATLDGRFTIRDLEAIAQYMRDHAQR